MSPEQISWLFLAIIAAIPIVLLILWLKARARASSTGAELIDIKLNASKLGTEKAKLIEALEGLERRFRPVIDIDKELASVKDQHRASSSELAALRAEYASKKEIYDRLRHKVAIFDEQLSFAEFGVYEPHFEFGDSETYKHSIKAVREEQKARSKKKRAVVCGRQWTLEGSTSKGQTMINRTIRLTLRAFNNECDAAIANVRWNNANAMIRRIENAKTQIDKANASLYIAITDKFLVLKLNELRLTHEYREKLKLERDQRAERGRLERDEKRLLKEAEEARKEEDRYQALLAKARAEAGVASSEEQEARIRELEQQLAEAHEKTERARAMAEKTKSGFVYIISNIGSFGDDVVKIGLTRRLDPTDRVRELGDASVPFRFDTHAMIYSEEAPELEAALHAEFGDRRINMANMRKEFFRVSLDEVEEAVKRLAPDAEFHKDIEAQEFHETLARRQEKVALEEAKKALEFPEEI